MGKLHWAPLSSWCVQSTLLYTSKHTHSLQKPSRWQAIKQTFMSLKKKTNSDRAGSRATGQIKLEIRNHKIFSPTQIFIRRSCFDDGLISSCSHDDCRNPPPPAPLAPTAQSQQAPQASLPRFSRFKAREECPMGCSLQSGSQTGR